MLNLRKSWMLFAYFFDVIRNVDCFVVNQNSRYKQFIEFSGLEWQVLLQRKRKETKSKIIKKKIYSSLQPMDVFHSDYSTGCNNIWIRSLCIKMTVFGNRFNKRFLINVLSSWLTVVHSYSRLHLTVSWDSVQQSLKKFFSSCRNLLQHNTQR